MSMPRPGPAHEKLSVFVGEWTSTETMHPAPWSPEGGERRGSLRARMLDGCFLITDYEQRDGEEVAFRGHGVYGFDVQSGRYTMRWFDSMGTDPGAPVPGTWEGDTLTFQRHTPVGHMRYRYQFDGDDAYRFSMAVSLDGVEWSPLMDGTYLRSR